MKELKEIIDENMNIPCIPGIKLDQSFPSAQFLTNDYRKPYRLDVSLRSGGLFVHVTSYLLLQQLSRFKILSNIQIICFEISWRMGKWLFLRLYKPKQQDSFAKDNHIILGKF